MITLRDYQETSVSALRAAYASGKKAPLLALPTGGGKCLAPGTPVMMHDGRVLPVESIKVGDLLMGPDSSPRRVVSLSRGREEMFRVTPKKGSPYTVNKSHILSLKMTGGSQRSCGISDGTIINISVAEYIAKNKTFKHCAKGWRVGVEFPPNNEPVKIDPYFLGLWLGDGSSRHPSITTGDPEIADAVRDYAKAVGLSVREEFNSENSVNLHLTTQIRGLGRGHRSNPVKLALHQYGLIQNKHIPHRYLTADRDDRLAILAGIIDTDGNWTGKGFDICLKSERLLDGVVFLARSLGLCAYKSACSRTCTNNGAIGTYWRCHISGHVDEIPCRVVRKRGSARRQIKNGLLTGISVESVGDGEYFGFELSGPDRLFLLGDFTVTHNTVIFSYVTNGASARGKRVLIVAHRRELIRQASRKLSDVGVQHGIIAPGFTPTRDMVQVASIQTLGNRLDKVGEFDLIVIDEAHHSIAGQWMKLIASQPRAKLLGVTATPERGDGRGLGISAGGVFDELVTGPSVQWLTDRGYLSPARVFAPAHAPDLSGVAIRMGDYERAGLANAMNKPTITGDAEEHYRKYLNGAPAIVFCVDVQHAKDVASAFQRMGWRATAADGSMKASERDSAIGGLATGAVQVLCTCDLISEGLDVPIVSGVVLLRSTKSLGLFLQQVGRGLRTAPGKEHLVVLDHAGCTLRHGMPNADRVWSLDGRPKKDQAPPTKQCKVCFAIFSPQPVCPECGHSTANEDKAARELEIIAGELEEINQARLDTIRRTPLAKLLTGRESYAELEEIRKAKKYHPFWTRHQMHGRRGMRA